MRRALARWVEIAPGHEPPTGRRCYRSVTNPALLHGLSSWRPACGRWSRPPSGVTTPERSATAAPDAVKPYSMFCTCSERSAGKAHGCLLCCIGTFGGYTCGYTGIGWWTAVVRMPQARHGESMPVAVSARLCDRDRPSHHPRPTPRHGSCGVAGKALPTPS